MIRKVILHNVGRGGEGGGHNNIERKLIVLSCSLNPSPCCLNQLELL